MSSQAVPQPTRFLTEAGATELLLIRHGRSADVVPGSQESLDPPLHAEGEVQAETLGRRLGPDRKRIDAVYASDLRRAVATADFLARPRGLATAQRPTLREVWPGDWEAGEFRRRAKLSSLVTAQRRPGCMPRRRPSALNEGRGDCPAIRPATPTPRFRRRSPRIDAITPGASERGEGDELSRAQTCAGSSP